MQIRWFMLLLATLGLPKQGQAFTCKYSKSYNFISLHWEIREITFGIEAGTPADRVSAVEASFVPWVAPACTDLQFQSADFNAAAGKVVFVENAWDSVNAEGESRPLDAVALTVTQYAPQSGVIRAAMIEVNEDFFDFGDITEMCGDGAFVYDLISVVTHEVGHLIGIDHPQNFDPTLPEPTMGAQVDACDATKRTLEADDIAAVCWIYPSGQPAVNCGPLPTNPDGRYVENQPFGCRSTSAATPTDWWMSVLLVLYGRYRQRRGSPLDSTLGTTKACSDCFDET